MSATGWRHPMENALIGIWSSISSRQASRTALVDVASGCSWTFGELNAAAAERAGQLRGQRIVYAAGSGAGFVIESLAAWMSRALLVPLEAGAPKPAIEFDRVPVSAVLAKSTSGSTGAPRVVLFTADQLRADEATIVSTMKLEGMWNVGAVSLAHSYGFSNLVLTLVLHGIPLALAGSPLPDAIRRATNRPEPMTLAGVPAMWRAWHDAGIIDSRIAVAVSAGAPLPLDLERQVLDRSGVKIHNFLGSTECGAIAYDRSTAPRPDPALAGQAMDGVSLSASDDGCLVVRSAAVGSGYWPPKAGDIDVLGDGRFRTSDLVALRGSDVYLLGRASDVINVAGRKVHPAEIEARLRGHPAIAECVVFGIPAASARRGEEVVACIALRPGGGTTTEIARWLASQLPPWQQPRYWRVDPALQPDARGKIIRSDWKRRFLAQTTGAGPLP